MLDSIVQLRCPFRDSEGKFLGSKDRVFPNSVMNRTGTEGRRIVDVWGVLSDEDVMRALPRITLPMTVLICSECKSNYRYPRKGRKVAVILFDFATLMS